MYCRRESAPGKVSICLVMALLVLSLLFGNDAGAYIYDDFNGDGIDSAKWTPSGTPGLFSQSGGRLHFSATQDAQSLVSTRTFGPGFFRMEFYDFTSTNLEPAGSKRGAFAAIGLGTGANFVRIIRDQNGIWNTQTQTWDRIGVFELNYIESGQIQVHYVETGATAGQLGLYYDGTQVTFYYNTTLDPANGWQHTGWKTPGQPGEWLGVWTPNWTEDPVLFVRGNDPAGTTSFSVDNVNYNPVPEPATMLLLGLGLTGLAGIGRKLPD